MTVIRPFRAVRPAPEYAERTAALPYDVYEEKEARRETERNPLSFLCIDRAETQLPEGCDPYAKEVYEAAAALFKKEEKAGIYLTEKVPCYYLYALTREGRTQTGLVACSSVEDYIDGTCKKHEQTVVRKEQDRIRHVEALAMHTGPVFLIYKKNKTISEIISKEIEKIPLYDFASEDGIRHTVWRIKAAETIAALTECFEKEVPASYIADGHHRAASAVKAAFHLRERGEAGEEYKYFLSVLFPDDELTILPYNRAVRDLNGHTAEAFLGLLSVPFFVEELSGFGRDASEKVPAKPPEKKGELHMYLAETGRWYRLSVRPEAAADLAGDPVGLLDVSLLQNLILKPLLGIGDPRTDRRIEFVGGIRGTLPLYEKAEQTGGAAFSMYPTSVAELLSVADAGALMPPKSTWFEPKLRSGLFMHRLKEQE